MKLSEMIKCMDEPHKTRAYRAQIRGLDLERFEEVFGLLDCFDRRVVIDRFTGQSAADCIDCATSNLQDCPPRGLERHCASRFGKSGIETADGRFATFTGDSNDESGEAIEPWVEHNNPRELEEATECRHRQHAVRIVKPSADPVRGSCQWS